MEVIVIKQRKNNSTVAVVECPAQLSADVVANQWAKANGYSKFPTDCIYSCSVELTTFGRVMLANTSFSEIEAMEKEAYGE